MKLKIDPKILSEYKIKGGVKNIPRLMIRLIQKYYCNEYWQKNQT